MIEIHCRMSKARRERARKMAQGSISVLLVIVLVPIVSVAGLFIDASRYQLARSEVAAAADLTLNTALADYDTILKDVYGLFAVSQSEDELQEKLRTYFTGMLIDAGVASDAASAENNPLLQNILDASTGETSNLLTLTMEEEGGVTFDGVAGSSLAEAPILKNQIVEYCKYRTPVNAAFSIIEGIKAISKTGKQMKVTQKQAEVDEAMEDLNKACKELYKSCKEYQDIDKSLLTSGDNVWGKSYEQHFLDTIVPAAVQKVIVPDEAGAWARGNNSYKSGYEVGSQTVSFNQTSGMRERDAEKLLQECDSITRQLENSSAPATLNGRDFSSLSPEAKRDYISTFETYMEDVYRLWRIYESYLNVEYSGSDKSSELADFKKGDGKRYQDLLQGAVNLTNRVNQGLSSYQDTLDDASNVLGAVRDDYNAKVSLLRTMSDKLADCEAKARKVEEKVGNVNSKNESFGSSIGNYTSNGSDSFSAQMDAAYEANKKILDENNFGKFKSRLAALKAYSDQYGSHFGSYRFLDKTLDSFTSLNNVVDQFNYATLNGSSVYNYVYSNSSAGVDSLSRTIVNSCFLCTVDAPASLELSIEDEEFYRYLKLTFAQDGKAADEESDLDSLRSSGEASASGATATAGLPSASASSYLDETSPTRRDSEITDGNASAGPDDNSNGVDASGMSKEKYSGMLYNMSGLVDELLAGVGDAMVAARDNLYVMDYAFSMFSWYTQEKEYEADAKDGQEAKTPQTPSGVAINDVNNLLYKAEVEYILYGKDSASENVSIALTYIFAIRFACNSIYALTDSEINAITLSPALAIQAASGGIIPYKIPQVVMKLALALAESAVDMHEMVDNGNAVALIKDSTTWRMSVKGGLETAKGLAVSAASKGIDAASDGLKKSLGSLLDNTADATVDSVKDLADRVEEAATEQVHQAVDGLFGAYSTSLQLSVSRLTTSIAESSDEAAARIVDEAKQAAQAYLDQQGSGSVRGALAAAYQEFIEGNSATLKRDISSKINELKSAADGKANEVISGLQAKIENSVNAWIGQAKDSAVGLISGEIKSLRDSVEEKLGSKIDDVSAEVKKNVADGINNWFDNNFSGYTGSMGSASNSVSAGFASCLKFRYSDYLKIFLYIKLCVNSDNYVLRIADLIEMNIKSAGEESDLHHARETGFSMGKAYTYYKLDANLGLSTMFLDMPLITKRMGVQEIASFPLSYKGAQGY